MKKTLLLAAMCCLLLACHDEPKQTESSEPQAVSEAPATTESMESSDAESASEA